MTIKEILIIGGHGYIGTSLTQALEKNFKISSPKRQEVDLSKPETFEVLKSKKSDLIIMLASSIRAISGGEQDPKLVEENVCYLNNFLSFVKDNSLTQKFINISSMAVYGKQPQVMVSEKTALNPFSLYGLTKKMAEDVVRYYSNNNFQTVNLRIPGIYGGKRQSGLLYHAKNKAKKNEPITIETKGLTNWETLHLDDLCSLIKQFIENYSWQENFNVFNLGYGHETDLIKTVETIVKKLSSKSEIKINSKEYDDFYMNTDKAQTLLKNKVNFEQSLFNYISE